ncbi:MAG: HAD-IA family hydrolase [Deltaproteobacteria bacterium]|nr:HAD-IA family hydrolase [Deltaproteobacteria bacterium]
MNNLDRANPFDGFGKVRAITLDMGWTLAYPSPGLWETLSDICNDVGRPRSAEACEAAAGALAIAAQQMAVARFDGARAYSDSDEKFRAGFRALSQTVFAQAGVDDEEGELFRRFFQLFNDIERWRVYPDVAPFLEAAREAGVRVGLISNAGTGLVETIRAVGLDRHLDVATISAAEGIRKPDRRIYALTLERLGVQPEEALHVGDFYLEDVVGPRQIGLRGVLIDRGANSLFPNFPQQDHHEDPDLHVIRSLDELRPVLS